MTSVTVVIPARNAGATLDRQLTALAPQAVAAAAQVIVVDNGSTDDTAERARRWRHRIPGLEVLSVPRPRGASVARNVGARRADGDVLLFCDADDIADAEWVASLVEAARRHDVVGGPIHLVTAGTTPSGLAASLHEQEGPTSQLGFLPAFVAGNLAIRRSALTELGGWNERYRSGEDTELCWRAQLAGLRLGWAPRARITYYVDWDAGTVLRKSYRFGRAEARLYHDFARHGMPRRNAKGSLRQWAWCLRQLPSVVWQEPAERSRLAGRLGAGAGRLAGSVRYRVLYL